MREILFRGRRSWGNKDWVEGDLLHGYSNHVSITKRLMGIETWQVDPETVGQYTGLTDRNGVKIFEGDIIEGDLNDDLELGAKWRSEIVWGKFGWMCKDRQTLPMDEYDIREGEVIGNIYDNPELLGGNKNG